MTNPASDRDLAIRKAVADAIMCYPIDVQTNERLRRMAIYAMAKAGLASTDVAGVIDTNPDAFELLWADRNRKRAWDDRTIARIIAAVQKVVPTCG